MLQNGVVVMGANRMQISPQLTMADVATLLGWVRPATGRPGRADTDRVRRRLRRIEQESGNRVLHGGGRPGKPGGGRVWTTNAALRKAGLVDDWEAMTDAVRVRIEELGELVDLLDERQRATARALAQVSQQLAATMRKASA